MFRGRVFFLLTLSSSVACAPTAAAQQDVLAQHYDSAQASLRRGDHEQASIEYKAFLGEALHRVANARAHAGDLSLAAQTFEEALSFPGADSGMRLDYASVLLDRGWNDQAGSVAQSVLTSEPNNLRAHVIKGRACFEQKDYVGAREHLESAVAGGRFSEVWRLLAITYLRLHQLDSARALLRKARTELGETPRNRVSIATTYYYGDYPDQAVEELKALIAQDNTAPDAHYFLGLAYLGHNEQAGYARATPEFQAQLKIDPSDFRSRYMLGYIALQKRDFAQAERDLLRAAVLNPADEGTQLSLAQVYSDTNRKARGEEVLRKLIASRKKDEAPDFLIVRAHYMLGRLLQLSGRGDEGADEIRTSERLRKELRLSSAEAAEGRDRENRILAAQGAGDGQARAAASPAEQQKAQAFVHQLSPLIGEAYYNLAGLAAQSKDSTTAEQYFQKAVNWDPSLRTAPGPAHQ